MNTPAVVSAGVDLGLQDKVALVTGAGQGIGRAIGLAFAQEGAKVAFHYNSSEVGAEKAAAEARELGAEAMVVQADIAQDDAVASMVDQVSAELGPVDVLVNNAAYTEAGPFLDMDPTSWLPQFEVTVLGMMRVTQAVLRGMVERGGGAIVNLMGDSGRVGESKLSAVATTRAATMGFTKSIAKEHGRNGVRANVVSLGLVQSENFDVHSQGAVEDDERMKRILSMYPLRRLGVVDDVPPMVLVLASPRAGWVTGHVVSISGGYAMP